MTATYSFRPNSLSNVIGMSDWLCKNCKIQGAMMLTNWNELQDKNMFYILTAIRGMWESVTQNWACDWWRFIDQRCSWNEHGLLWTDWQLNEFLLQKLAEEQAKTKRLAEAVDLVMQGLRVQLEELKSRNDESVLTILQLVPRQSTRSLLLIKFLFSYYAQKYGQIADHFCYYR